MAKKIIAMSAPVAIEAAQADGEKKSPAKFVSTFYTGGMLNIANWDLPVVIDLAGLTNSKVLVANLDHDASKRVGNFSVANDGRSLVANGTATAHTAARDEVVQSAADGYQWQSSLEVSPTRVEEVKAGKKFTANGQTFEGPAYFTRAGVLKGFAFVSHGADDNTTATIAASAAHQKKGLYMKAEIKAWAEGMGVDVENLNAEQVAAIEANYEGKNGKKSPVKASADPFEARKLEAQRRTEIQAYADSMAAKREGDVEWINSIEAMCAHAIEAKMGVNEFRIELQEAMAPAGFSVVTPRSRDNGVSNRVLEAAVCMAGRMSDDDLVKKHRFTDQELQSAHDKFKGRIGLKQLFFVAAEANGYRSNYSSDITPEVQNAAFGYSAPRQMHASGFSTLSISTILSNVANKFMRDGFNSIDQTCLRISAIRNVNDFKTITTTSLTDGVIFEKVGAAGEIKHGTLGEIAYSNKADTYAKMLAITRTDYINDDLGALTMVPKKLGNGAMKKLNDIFWTEYLALVSANFFGTANVNINTAVADMTIGGLKATETIFMNQTNPDGTPLGLMPAILLVPTALKADAIALMDPQSQLITGASATLSNANPFRGRFRVESSPYISNSSYTGNTSAGWWMLANPSDCPVIEIAALNGRIEPTVETADAEFNVLGVQMRGYSDVGVKRQEYRGGVYADGGAS
jgi:hypothetical protein